MKCVLFTAGTSKWLRRLLILPANDSFCGDENSTSETWQTGSTIKWQCEPAIPQCVVGACAACQISLYRRTRREVLRDWLTVMLRQITNKICSAECTRTTPVCSRRYVGILRVQSARNKKG
ncbi:hypothetical protein M426DRAFT_316731 [Hypoxylon sp. CI-4A]|nr:hypothetical protein M426DRAFT_316731 [Hypoxylon sp. CI-4A]